MQTSKKAKKLVVDTNAFIKGVKIENIGSEFYTIPQVIEEVRDAKARQFLATFPFQIKTKDPSPTGLKAVAAFARKTGDYAFLSAADLRVLALVYTLEAEAKKSTSHLRTTPLKPAEANEAKKEEQGEKDEEEEVEEGEEEGEETEKNEENTDKEIEAGADKAAPSQQENSQPSTTDTQNTKEPSTSNATTDETTDDTTDGQDTQPEENAEKDNGFGGTDDDDGWITPDNIGFVRAKSGQEEDDTSFEEVDVGCFTTDYAMQSVLLQMGLKLLSVEGMVIKKIRQYVLKCYGCFRICKDMERKFCPQCGGQTLLRFSAQTDDKGNLVYTQAQRLTTRGTIFPLPQPKGGRNSGDLILSEDQYLHKTRYMRDKKIDDVFSSDYAFAQKKTGPSNRVVIGYGNKNPNIAKRKIGKNNKPISSMQN